MRANPERLLSWLRLQPQQMTLSSAFVLWDLAVSSHGPNMFARVSGPTRGRRLHFVNLGRSRDGWASMLEEEEDDYGLCELGEHGRCALACAKPGDYIASLERQVLRVLEIIDVGAGTVRVGPPSVKLREADSCPAGMWYSYSSEHCRLPDFIVTEALLEGRRLGRCYSGEEVAVPIPDTRLTPAQGVDAEAMSWACGFAEGVLPMWLESIERRA